MTYENECFVWCAQRLWKAVSRSIIRTGPYCSEDAHTSLVSQMLSQSNPLNDTKCKSLTAYLDQTTFNMRINTGSFFTPYIHKKYFQRVSHHQPTNLLRVFWFCFVGLFLFPKWRNYRNTFSQALTYIQESV